MFGKYLKAGIWLLTALVFTTRCDCFQLLYFVLNLIERIEYDDWKLWFTSECVQLCEWNDLCIKKFKNNSFEEKLLCKNGYDMIGSSYHTVSDWRCALDICALKSGKQTKYQSLLAHKYVCPPNIHSCEFASAKICNTGQWVLLIFNWH